jgi:hypothetical protein
VLGASFTIWHECAETNAVLRKSIILGMQGYLSYVKYSVDIQ